MSFITVEAIDSNSVVVPNADNLINFVVTGGTIVGVDNGRQESSESYKTAYREAFNGKALAIVQSTKTPGPITITATSSGLLPATTTVYSVLENGQSELIALEPVYVRTMAGTASLLPETVQGIYADGTQQSLPVEWDEFEEDLNAECGIYMVKGQVTGESIQAEAVITVYDIGGIESYSTVVATDTAPALPTTVRLVYNDGVDQFVPVTWGPIDPEKYASPGQFTVTGTIAETTVQVQANIRVTADVTTNQNIAQSASPLGPTADASYSGAEDTLPAAMLDGNKTSGGWSNYYNKEATTLLPAFSEARPNDWVSIVWPNPQKVDNLNVYFTISSMPSSIAVSYWNGESFVPVNNPNIVWATESNQATIVTFDPVATTQLRLDMTSKFPGIMNGFLQITELEVMGNVVTYNTTAPLEDLKINGQTIDSFDSDTTTYTVSIGKEMPKISATVADNGRIVIMPPLTLPGTATVSVTSEEGLAQKTYYIDFILDY